MKLENEERETGRVRIFDFGFYVESLWNVVLRVKIEGVMDE